MNLRQYRRLIIRETLMKIGLHSPEAEALVLGTVLAESSLKYIKQIGGGPALGFMQMEPATHDDIWVNFLKGKKKLAGLILAAANLPKSKTPAPMNLMFNLVYGVAMCRAHYLRKPGIVPKTLEDQAHYWKKYYNTYLGGGSVKSYLAAWGKYVV